MLPTTKTKPQISPSKVTTLIYGQPKIGKSTFCSQFPDAVFLATEPGLNHLETYQVPINSYSDLQDVFLELEAGNHNFKTIIFDTADRLYEIVRQKVLKELCITDESEAEWGKGYARVKKTFTDLVYHFTNLPYGVVFVSHSETKDEKDRLGNIIPKHYPTLQKRARECLVNLVDVILFVDLEVTTDDQGNKVENRVIRTKGTISYEAGDRTGKLPDTLPLDYKAYAKALEGAVKK